MLPDRNDILNKTLQDFPDTPTMTLAKKLANDYPTMFLTVEAARSAIRHRRGTHGAHHRKYCSDKTRWTEPGEAGFKFELPKSVAKYDEAFQLTPGRWLVLSDIHIPYHDTEALQVAIDYGKKKRVQNVILNGDIADFFTVSRWDKNPLQRDLAAELHDVRQFLGYMRQEFPKARIVFKLGNHEERWRRFLWLKAPELCGCNFVSYEHILDFDKFGIEKVEGRQIVKAGKHLTIIHGHEMRASNIPVNFARTLQTKLGACSIGGHLHSTSEHSFKTVDEKFITCWGVGCLCEMHPDYAVINNWNHGAAMVELEKDDFDVHNFRIINGKVY